MLVRGSEDGHEAAGPAGAPRGPGLSPVNKRHPEGLIREETEEEKGDQLDSTGAYLSTRMRKGLCSAASLHTRLRRTGVTKSKPFHESSLASLFPRVRGRELFGALLCVCGVNTLFGCVGVTDDRKKPFPV